MSNKRKQIEKLLFHFFYPETQKIWWITPNPVLDNKTPEEYIKDNPDSGEDFILKHLGSLAR